jgi:hypothetical protein
MMRTQETHDKFTLVRNCEKPREKKAKNVPLTIDHFMKEIAPPHHLKNRAEIESTLDPSSEITSYQMKTN